MTKVVEAAARPADLEVETVRTDAVQELSWFEEPLPADDRTVA